VAASTRELVAGLPYRLFSGKYFLDEIYEAALVRPAHWLSDRVLWRIVDATLIDGVVVNGVARVLSVTGQAIRLLQNGLLRWYAYSFVGGVLIVIVYLARRVG
jgi:NADH-quinone oxidoreductase subunit L